MTTLVSPPLALAEDTFEGRWARWIADGETRALTLHKRALGAVVLIASAFAIATVWTLRVM